MQTVRGMVRAMRQEILAGDLPPGRARDVLVKLTALYGNCMDAEAKAGYDYAAVLLQCLEQEKKANRAKIRAELTDEFRAKQDARNTRTLVEELIRSLKVWIKSQESEMRLVQ